MRQLVLPGQIEIILVNRINIKSDAVRQHCNDFHFFCSDRI
jgi:hypothetical protein